MWSSPGSSSSLWPFQREYGAVFQDPDDYAVPLVDVFEFLCEQKDKGVVKLTDDQEEKVDDLQETLDQGLEQLRGEHWSRLVFTADVPEEGEETYALLDQIRAIAGSYYGDDVVLVGNSPRPGPVGILRAGQFEDQCPHSPLRHGDPAVHLQVRWAPCAAGAHHPGLYLDNFSFPISHRDQPVLRVTLWSPPTRWAATIDYAIVITNRYMELKNYYKDRKQAAVEALSQSFPTILTSGSVMSVAGFLIAEISTDATIGSVGLALGRGTVTSIILVMTVLPQMLMLGDVIIEKTAITLNRNRKQRFHNGVMRVDGHLGDMSPASWTGSSRASCGAVWTP